MTNIFNAPASSTVCLILLIVTTGITASAYMAVLKDISIRTLGAASLPEVLSLLFFIAAVAAILSCCVYIILDFQVQLLTNGRTSLL